MKIVYSDKLPHVLIIKNFYNEEEIKTIWKELDTILEMDPVESKQILKTSAITERGSIRKSIGKWLHQIENNQNDLSLKKLIKFSQFLFQINAKRIINQILTNKNYDLWYSVKHGLWKEN